MGPSLFDIERGWLINKGENPEALGGRRALSGFGYQLHLSLERFFKGVRSGDPQAAMAFEGLGDLTESADGIYCFVQVKRNLELRQFKSAIQEAISVDTFLEQEFPELRPRFRYQIWCRTKGPRDLAQFLDADLALTEPEAARLRDLRPQLLEIAVREDPFVSLAITLFPHVLDPFDFLDGCIGDLVRRLGSNPHVTSDELCEALLRRWTDHRIKSEPPPGRLLSLADFEDKSAGRQDILVGRNPRLDDVNAGCFMRRPLHEASVLDYLRGANPMDSNRLPERSAPVVWISGPSGGGKSVMLLQSLKAIAEEGEYHVHLIPPSADNLLKALEYWRGQTERAVIAVDDIYAPQHRDRAIWTRIYNLVTSERWSVYPTVLTCGPKDYRSAFKADFQATGAFSLSSFNIPPLSREEQVDYLGWYNMRTGRDVTRLSSLIFVVAAFLLEVSRGDEVAGIGSFARRFQERLIGLGIEERMLAALAFNALDIPVPAALFESQKDQLNELVAEGSYRLDTNREGEDIVRMYHPAVARAVYAELVPEEQTQARARHLTQCLAAISKEHPEEAPARLLLLAVRANKDYLTTTVLSETLRLVYREIIDAQEPPGVSYGLLRAWCEISKTVDCSISPTTLYTRMRRWMANPDMDASGWALLCQTAWEFASATQHNTLAAEAMDWLDIHGDLPQWSYLWRILWIHRLGDLKLVGMAMEWLQANLQNPGWSFVFQDIVDGGIRNEAVLRIGLAGLAQGAPTVADTFLWAKVAGLNPDPRTFIGAILRRLARCHIPYVMARGFDFIGDRWRDVDAEELQRILREAADEAGWSYVWERLVDSCPTDAELLKMGRVWMVGRENEPEWSHVWRRLVESCPTDAELLKVGREWMVGRENQPDWNYVWRRLVESCPTDAELLKMGRVWMVGRENQPEWSHVWRRLVESCPTDAELLKVGREWMVGRENQPDWNYVWRRLVESCPTDAELLKIGREWLRDRENQPDWAFVWERLVDSCPTDAELRKIGRDWMVGRETRQEWHHVRRWLGKLQTVEPTR